MNDRMDIFNTIQEWLDDGLIEPEELLFEVMRSLETDALRESVEWIAGNWGLPTDEGEE